MLVVVSPETVVRWHRAGFHMYWRLLSRVQKQGGRRPVTAEIRELILKMMAENPTWLALRLGTTQHGEPMLGGEMHKKICTVHNRKGVATTDRKFVSPGSDGPQAIRAAGTIPAPHTDRSSCRKDRIPIM